MTSPSTPSRRSVVRLACTAPFLPLADSLARAVGAGVSTGDSPTLTSAHFIGMEAPSLAKPEEMAATHVASALETTWSDGSTQKLDLAYETFFHTGEWVDDGAGGKVLAGGCSDIHGEPLLDRSVPGRERQVFSDCPDGMSLLSIGGARVAGLAGNAVFAVVQFEYVTRDQSGLNTYGTVPSPIAVLTLDQDPATGRLRLVKYHDVDTSGAHGLWITCGASLSPWNTHLSSEEYEPDAAAPTESGREQFRRFSQNLYGDPDRANPYRYGHLPEVTVHPDGTGTVKKHYCLGRISHELVQVMPDERTVLMGDDWSNGGLFLFVADRPRDLSCGMLYVARWTEDEADPNAGALSWIRLGHATSDRIEAIVDSGKRAADIMDVRTTDPQDPTYTRIPYAGGWNWVRLRKGMERAAAFLETHRYAALRGGSLGFTKMEGTTVNVADRVAYTAISRVGGAMRNGSGGIRATGPYSGAVYALDLKSAQVDDGDREIDSAWVPVDMRPIPELQARDYPSGERDELGNRADPDHVATPDNLKFSERLRTLFIGEDSDTHVNNFLWAYHVDTKELSRVLSCPVGAESTGLHAVDELHGWTYIASNFQHAGDWNGLHDKVRWAVEGPLTRNYDDRFAAAVGYLTAARLGGG